MGGTTIMCMLDFEMLSHQMKGCVLLRSIISYERSKQYSLFGRNQSNLDGPVSRQDMDGTDGQNEVWTENRRRDDPINTYC